MTTEREGGRSGKFWKCVCIFAAVVISAVGWMRLRVDSSLEPMLPEHSEARETILFFRDSTFAEKAILWFRLKDGGTTADLFAAADATEKRLDPGIIEHVIRPPSEGGAMEEAVAMLDHAGELLNASDLADIEKAIAPEALRKRMRECYVQLTKPEGSFFEGVMRRDPLGVSTRILGRLYALTKGMGYRVQVKDGRFLSEDGRQLMLVLQTKASATSMSSSETLVNHLNALAAAAPAGVEITPICGQVHTVQNSELMQRDIHLAGMVSTAAFILLFLGVSRDWRVAAVFLMPLATTGVTIGLCALVHPDLSAMMIGLTVAMAGSAVDYGIFVYTAVRMGSEGGSRLQRIRRPLVISHLTTLGVFVAFLFSEIPAYRQLGGLTSVSLILSLLAALFVLPKLLKPGGKIVGLGSGMLLERWGKWMRPVTIAGAGLLAVGIYLAAGIRFDPDVTRLDGVSADVKQAERDFQKSWGRTDAELAILVVSGKTRAEAEQKNDEVNRVVAGHFGEGEFVSLSSFWPSAETREENEGRWQGFWTAERIGKLRADLAAAGKPFGFSERAFDPFFQTLTTETPKEGPQQILASLEEQFVARSVNGDWQMLNYFEDTPGNANALHQLLGERTDVLIASRGVLNRAFEKSAASETYLLISVAGVFIVGSLLALTRSVVKSLIILIPVAAGLIAMLAVLHAMSLPMSIVTVIAAIIVLALTSDYGVFAVYGCEQRETVFGQGMASMHLSFLTTLVGTGVMIFAKHPALYLVGVSLTSGLIAGYLTAFLLIPGMYFLRKRRTMPEAT